MWYRSLDSRGVPLKLFRRRRIQGSSESRRVAPDSFVGARQATPVVVSVRILYSISRFRAVLPRS